MHCFVILKKTANGFEQAHNRNKTYKTIDGAIVNGVCVWGDAAPKAIVRNDDSAVVRYQGEIYAIVDIWDVATQHATILTRGL